MAWTCAGRSEGVSKSATLKRGSPLLNRDSRITLCGMISQYANTDGGDSYERWREAGNETFERQGTKVHGLAIRLTRRDAPVNGLC